MFKNTLILASLIGASFAAQAVTVDLRHEYIDNETNADGTGLLCAGSVFSWVTVGPLFTA